MLAFEEAVKQEYVRESERCAEGMVEDCLRTSQSSTVVGSGPEQGCPTSE